MCWIYSHIFNLLLPFSLWKSIITTLSFSMILPALVTLIYWFVGYWMILYQLHCLCRIDLGMRMIMNSDLGKNKHLEALRKPMGHLSGIAISLAEIWFDSFKSVPLDWLSHVLYVHRDTAGWWRMSPGHQGKCGPGWQTLYVCIQEDRCKNCLAQNIITTLGNCSNQTMACPLLSHFAM